MFWNTRRITSVLHKEETALVSQNNLMTSD